MSPARTAPARSRPPVPEPGTRTRTAAATRATALAVAALTTVTLAACSGTRDAAATPNGPTKPGPSVGTALDAPLPARILDLPFTTTTGSTVRLRDLTGKLVVISDAMSLCQETCPLDTATIVNTARDEPDPLGADDTVFLSITVDPKRDTRAQLAAYRRLFTPAPPNWLVLTGAPATVDTLWDYLGVWRQKVTNPPGTARHHTLTTSDPTNWTLAQALQVLTWLQNK